MCRKKKEILILGTLPPPVGGVTIHVQRLLGLLEREKIPYSFCPIRKTPFWSLLRQIISHKVIHLHISHIPATFFLALICCVLQKKLIMTRHGDICRHRGFLYHIDLWSIRLASVPILLNQISFSIARKYNCNALLMSAFLPPATEEILSKQFNKMLLCIRKRYRYLFVTNAFNLSFDDDGKEIYGITELIEIFRDHPDLFLVAATCNEKYFQYLLKKGIFLPDNVLILQEPVSFWALLKLADGMIRHTTTDGDSLSVREALYLGKEVLVTDCVPRPAGAIVYHDRNELVRFLENFIPGRVVGKSAAEDGTKIITLYRRFLEL